MVVAGEMCTVRFRLSMVLGDTPACNAMIGMMGQSAHHCCRLCSIHVGEKWLHDSRTAAHMRDKTTMRQKRKHAMKQSTKTDRNNELSKCGLLGREVSYFGSVLMYVYGKILCLI